jgi:hypothetical protein
VADGVPKFRRSHRQDQPMLGPDVPSGERKKMPKVSFADHFKRLLFSWIIISRLPVKFQG